MSERRFYEIEPTVENYWRAVILFGRNVASYKFALAKALFDLRAAASSNDVLKLEDIAPHFAGHIAEHLKHADKQATSPQSQFLDFCRKYNSGAIDKSQLLDATVRLGFVNVIDAFHNVHGDELRTRFFLDERRTSGGIRLTEEFLRLAENERFRDLNAETESRWRLVETAWELRVPRQVVQVTCDASGDMLHAATCDRRRTNVTATRDALNGYQKGKCFYCYREFSIDPVSDVLADVDHFFPHKLFYCAGGKPIDGVANLVLSCKDCNRGSDGKFDRLPKIELLERLHTRNEYLIGSHHPLRETLMLQTGTTERDRRSFLQAAYDCATTHLIAKWAPSPTGSPVF